MYNYKLLNNHFIVFIDNLKFLIDTGSQNSFSFSHQVKSVTINGHEWRLQDKPSIIETHKVYNLVGESVDGFIGLDIILKTGLTIYKNGTLEFATREINGVTIPLISRYSLMINVEFDSKPCTFIIDTGAKYAYGLSKFFIGKEPIAHVQDYNPILGNLESDLFNIKLCVGNKERTIDVCYNEEVNQGALLAIGVSMIGNITTFFDEALVIDTINQRLILK